MGRVHDSEADSRYLPPPKFAPVRLHLDPVHTEIPDPTGVSGLLFEELRTTTRLQAHGVPVLIRGGDEIAGNEGDAAFGYRLRLRILDLEDGRISGFRVPMLVDAPRAEAEVHVLAQLFDESGLPLGREEIFEAKVSQGLGTTLAPLTTSHEKQIVPDEIRDRLRRKVVEKVAKDIATAKADVIGSREAR